MKEKNVIVTGGAGFIGSNLVRNLINKNNVIVIDDLSTGRLENIRNFIETNKIEFIQGSITDFNLLKKVLKDIDYVFHEAAIPSVPRSIRDPITTSNVNINGTLNVLLAAKKCGVKKVIFASSSSVYGDIPTLPKQEKMISNPLSPYAIGKLTGEYFCNIFTKIYNLPTIALRYFNVYGPRQDPNSEYAAVIPKFITKILDGIPPVIYGDGHQTRDFTFIDDVISANVLAVESDSTGVFNIANADRISINELALKIMRLCNKNLQIKYEKSRPGDIKHSLADIAKAKEKLKFSPNFNLDYGLKETIQWFQEKR